MTERHTSLLRMNQLVDAPLSTYLDDRRRGAQVLRSADEFVLGLRMHFPGAKTVSESARIPVLASASGARALIRTLELHPFFSNDPPSSIVVPDSADGLDQIRGEGAARLLVAGVTAITMLDAPQKLFDGLARIVLSADDFADALRFSMIQPDLPTRLPPRIPPLRSGLPSLADQCIGDLGQAMREFAAAAKLAFPTADANGITRIDPVTCCAGENVEIFGRGFGFARPPDTFVYFPRSGGGCLAADCLHWTVSRIVVRAPNEVGPGCVGFVRWPQGQAEFAAARLAEAFIALGQAAESCLGPASVRMSQRMASMSFNLHPCPPCTSEGTNRLVAAGVPRINWFRIDGEDDALQVAPGTPLVASWSVESADEVSLERLSGEGNGPPVPNVPLDLTDTLDLGGFHSDYPVVAIYRLTATNRCGASVRIISVTVVAHPDLEIKAVSVVQAIQAPDQSVTLVAGKRTAVRVLVGSGLPPTWHAGGNPPGSQPDVTGQVTVRRAGDPSSPITLNPLNKVVGKQAGRIDARHDPTLDRSDDALFFELPLSYTHQLIELRVRVLVSGKDDQGDGYTARFGPMYAAFAPQMKQEILPFLISDTLHGGTPTEDGLRATLAGALPMFPVAEDGLVVKQPPLRGNTDLGPGIRADLTTKGGWHQLVMALSTTVFLFPGQDVGGLRTAFVPVNLQYALHGVGMWRVFFNVPSCVVQVGKPDVLVHEWGHTYLIGHAPCPPQINNPDLWNRLEPDLRYPAVDVTTRAIFPAKETHEIMSYCTQPARRPSEVFWEEVRVRIPN